MVKGSKHDVRSALEKSICATTKPPARSAMPKNADVGVASKHGGVKISDCPACGEKQLYMYALLRIHWKASIVYTNSEVSRSLPLAGSR